ncbi:hypothetical protein EMPS_07854 [Entomortierella parvispora]|uniref:Ankyrin n=1 Tax=Entomortierella parvispora TaxID=205924 RepID=A0A9P3HF86_9FUNG|nr:hypothetical protein EMPS_07854 [Entomortierella parvispora]
MSPSPLPPPPSPSTPSSARPVIPQTFITLSAPGMDEEEEEDCTSDSDLPAASSSSPPLSATSRKRTITDTNERNMHNPYLASAGTSVGIRSLSTPNLHANDTSAALLTSPMPSPTQSPASSPPISPSLPPFSQTLGSSVAAAAGTDLSAIDTMAPLTLPLLDHGHGHSGNNNDGDTPQRHHSDNTAGASDRLVLTLSPMASPLSSPRLAPRLPSVLSSSSPASTLPSSALPPLNGRSILSETAPSRSKATSTLSGAGATADSRKTLKSTKNKTVNRNSVISLFDTTTSSMTLPTNFARKGSLPQDTANGAQGQRLAGLFAAQQAPDLTGTPFSMTLAEFRLNDIYPKRQRRLLTVLHRMDNRLRKEGVIRKLTKEQLKGKPDKEILKPDRKSLNKDYAKKGGQGGFMAQRIPAFLRSKKLKKRTRPVILHNIEMAIRDKKPELALQYISLLPSNALKKKKKKSHSDLNHCMLLAMIYRMEQVAIELVDRGFPIDVNYPIIGRARDEYKTKPGRTGPFEYPSYFIVAVGLGMHNLVRAMIKNANLNQSWCGLTPLLLAVTLNECTNATCPPPTLPPARLASMLSRGEHLHLDIASQTLINQLPSSFNKSTATPFRIPNYTPTSPNSIVTTLLQYGADPNLGITLQQYLWANKLKGMGAMHRRRKAADFHGTPDENPIEFYIAARRHESGRQWLSHDEIKARKATKLLLRKTMTTSLNTGGKTKISTEMQTFWKGKSILPVEMAIAAGNLDCARTILQRLGPNSLSGSSFGLLLQNDVMLTLSLIKSGSPVSQHDLHGCTPLHLAARRGHLEMVMVLVQLGGNVNSRGERGWTPLHESISQNHAQISSLLLLCGADLEARNDAGETPEELGYRCGLDSAVLAHHLDTSVAASSHAGLVHSFASHLPNHLSTADGDAGNRSSVSSRRASHEQLTASTLKSMMKMSNNGGASGTASERNSVVVDLSRLSQHYPSINGGGDTHQNGIGVNNGHDNGIGGGYRSSLIASQEPLSQHQYRPHWQ